MGKDSLIKSTAGKKNSSKKKPARPKKQNPKKSTPTTRDLIFKKFDSQQTKSASSAHMVPPIKTESAPQPNEVTVMDDATRELIFKRFSMAEIRSAAKASNTIDIGSAVVADDQSTLQANNNSAPSLLDPQARTSDPVFRSMMYGIAVLALLFALIIGASIRNNAKYFMVAQSDAVEIWRGRFAPTGKEFYSILHNYRLIKPSKPFYSKQEIFPVMFNYYIQKADDGLESQNIPNFLEIHNYLNSASQYTITDQMQHAVLLRMNTIEQMTSLYKADVAINKGTPHSLELAIHYLKDAQALSQSGAQRQILDERIALVEAQLNDLLKNSTETPKTDKPSTTNTPAQ